jgi:hypothetical protein
MTKMQNFTKANDLQTMPTDPPKTYQTSVRRTINSSKTLIPQDTKWKYINMNPSAPTIKGLIKLHKQNQSIRPVVNWRNAPAYKLAKLFTQKINHLAPLPNAFNIENSRDLINKLNHTPTLPQFRLASLTSPTYIPISQLERPRQFSQMP